MRVIRFIYLFSQALPPGQDDQRGKGDVSFTKKIFWAGGSGNIDARPGFLTQLRQCSTLIGGPVPPATCQTEIEKERHPPKKRPGGHFSRFSQQPPAPPPPSRRRMTLFPFFCWHFQFHTQPHTHHFPAFSIEEIGKARKYFLNATFALPRVWMAWSRLALKKLDSCGGFKECSPFPPPLNGTQVGGICVCTW